MAPASRSGSGVSAGAGVSPALGTERSAAPPGRPPRSGRSRSTQPTSSRSGRYLADSGSSDRIGDPVPVGDALDARLELLGDRGERVALLDLVGREARPGRRRRPEERRRRGRARRAWAPWWSRRASPRRVGGRSALAEGRLGHAGRERQGHDDHPRNPMIDASVRTMVTHPRRRWCRSDAVSRGRVDRGRRLEARTRRRGPGPRRRSRCGRVRRAWRRSRPGRRRAGSTAASSPSIGKVAIPIDALTPPPAAVTDCAARARRRAGRRPDRCPAAGT